MTTEAQYLEATAAKFAAFKAQAATMTLAQLDATISDTAAPYMLRQYAIAARQDIAGTPVRTR